MQNRIRIASEIVFESHPSLNYALLKMWNLCSKGLNKVALSVLDPQIPVRKPGLGDNEYKMKTQRDIRGMSLHDKRTNLENLELLRDRNESSKIYINKSRKPHIPSKYYQLQECTSIFLLARSHQTR